MDNCFEKHRVNLDPSSSRTEITTVYRPIDRFYTPLPYLIGERNWKEKWHLGLIEEDKFSQTGSVYAESVESNASRLENDTSFLPSESILTTSQTSLSKSSSSIGSQMIINIKPGLFEEPTATTQPNLFFHPPPATRVFVNLFDDEPPELPVKSASDRLGVNLFDEDIESVASMPFNEPSESFDAPLPPVDIFNDSEFDNFIKKMETEPSKTKSLSDMPKKQDNVSDESRGSGNMQANMKSIADEIKTIQLRKSENVKESSSTVTKTVVHVSQLDKKPFVEEPLKADKPVTVSKTPVNSEFLKAKETSIKTDKPVSSIRPRITNLFDDEEDDTEDFFQEIIKQKKSQPVDSKLSQVNKKEEEIPAKKQTTLKRPTNLFDDEDDDNFDSILAAVTASTPKNKVSSVASQGTAGESKTIKSLTPLDSETRANDKITVDSRHKSLFDDDDDDYDEKMFESRSVNKPESKVAQESEQIIPEKNQQGESENSFRSVAMTDDSSKFVDSPSTVAVPFNMNDNINQSTKNINRGELTSESHITDKSIIANCPDDNAVPNVITDTENQNIVGINKSKENLEQKTDAITDKSLELSRSPQKEFNNSILFVSDVPPDDDDSWDTEENNFEEPEMRDVVSHNTYNYLAFNDIPPDDDFTESISQNNYPSDNEDTEKLKDFSQDNLPEDSETTSTFPGSRTALTSSIFKKMFETDSSALLINEPEIQSVPEKETIIKKPISEKLPQKINPFGNIPSDESNTVQESEQKAKNNFKSKLDLFSNAQESQAIVKKESSSKKLPGKLSTNLNINVSALMPGVRISVKKPLQTEESSESQSVEEPDSSSSTDKSLSITEKSTSEISSMESSTSTGLLNNDIAKSRARIQVKRRPSTRKGRRSVYEQTLSANIEEYAKEPQENDECNEPSESISQTQQFDSHSSSHVMLSTTLSEQELNQNSTHEILQKNEVIRPSSLERNVSQSTEIKREENVNEIVKVNENKNDDSSHGEIKVSIKTTIKSRVFYDDEDETRQMLQAQKKKKQEKSSLWLFDDANDTESVASTSSQPVKQENLSKPLKSSLFDEDSDNDLFVTSKLKKVETVKKPAPAKSIFNDDYDGDDLFGAPAKKPSEKLSTQLFDSSDDKLKTSLIFSKPESTNQPKNKSIFGDDEDDDDDDLFSTRSKSSGRFILELYLLLIQINFPCSFQERSRKQLQKP